MKREGSWMAFYGDAFFESERVVSMSPAAGHLYMFLLWHEFKNGPFASDRKFLRRLCSRFEEFETLWPEVEPCFQKSGDGRLSQHRCEAERAESLELAKKRSKAAFARWEKLDLCKSNASAVDLHCKTGQTGKTDTPPSEVKARGKPRLSISDAVKGTALDRPDFLEAMESWESSHGPYKPTGLRAQLHRLGAWGPDRAAAAIRYSLAQGFQGIYEDKNGHPTPQDDDANVRQQIEQLARVSKSMNQRTLIT